MISVPPVAGKKLNRTLPDMLTSLKVNTVVESVTLLARVQVQAQKSIISFGFGYGCRFNSFQKWIRSRVKLFHIKNIGSKRFIFPFRFRCKNLSFWFSAILFEGSRSEVKPSYISDTWFQSLKYIFKRLHRSDSV